MRIEYEISEQDFLDGQKLAIKNLPTFAGRWVWLMFPFYAAIGTIVGIGAVKKSGELTFDEIVIGALAFGVMAVLFPFLTKNKQRKLYAKSTNLHGPIVTDIDSDGFGFYSPLSSGKTKWASFSKFCEDKKSFVLFQQSGRIINILPKRQLTPDVIAELHQLLSSHLPSK
jgi:YcxB-like protein